MKSHPWRMAGLMVSLTGIFVAVGFALAQIAKERGPGVWWGFFSLLAAICLFVWLSSLRSRGVRRHNAARATGLGWRQGSASYWAGLKSEPFDTAGVAVSDGSLHGVWHGYPAESIYYAAAIDDESAMNHTHRVELVVIDARFPELAIAPRHGRFHLERSDDLQFESAEFNRRFLVSTSEPAFAHAILHPRMLERLLQPDVRGLDITLERNVVMTSRWSMLKTVRGLEKRLTVLTDIAELIPEHAKSQYGEAHLGEKRAAAETTSGRVWSREPRSKRKNWIAWAGLAFVWTGVGSPIGVALAELSLRAYRLRQSTNGAFARKVRLWGYMVLVPLALVALVAISLQLAK